MHCGGNCWPIPRNFDVRHQVTTITVNITYVSITYHI